jgi:glycosyltransferase involved in cell wall biosynthesis
MGPCTSVIIPVRNGVRFIEEAVHSALHQLESEDEILIVDDASTDGTPELLKSISDRRIRLLVGSGKGVSSARNIGLREATGEFVAFLDHDDLWPEHRHAALLDVLLADVSLDCAFGRIRLRIEPDAVITRHLAGMDGQLSPSTSLCTALFRRRILHQVGNFDESMQHCEDTDYFMRLVEQHYRMVLCDVDALIYRRHSANATCDSIAMDDGLMQLLRRRRKRNSARR